MKILFYIAVLTGLIIVVAYYAGSTNLLATLGSVVNSLLLTLQGRTSSGTFASYPGNAPAVAA